MTRPTNTTIPQHICAFVLPAILLAALPAAGQGTRTDYERSAALRRTTENKVFRDRVQPNWLAGGTQFWYRVRIGPDRHEFILVDAAAGTRAPAFDHQRLAAALVEAGQNDARADRLPIDDLDFRPAEKQVDFRSGGKWWRCSLETYRIIERPGGAPPGRTASAARLRPVESGPRASTRTGPETSVTFINHGRGEVELFWLDTEGRRQSYGKLRPGQERQQHTFAGHVWIVVDEKGKPLGVFEAVEKESTVEIPANPAPGPRSDPAPAADGAKRVDASRQKSGPPRPRGAAAESPDGRWTAFVKDNQVWLRSSDGSKEFPLSNDPNQEDAYSYNGTFFWSPDSKRLIAVKTNKGDDRQVYFIESSPRDQIQPKLHSHSYAKPGDRLPVDRPQLFNVAARKPVPVTSELFSIPWSITEICWDRDSTRFTFVYNQRGHQALRLVAVDASTGAVRPIIDERSPTFIDYSGKYFVHYLADSGEAIWMSERDGWNHLYLYDTAAGKAKCQITKGPWVVRGVDRVDDQKRQVWFRAGGIRPGQDPYHVHHCHVNFDGSGLVVLTEGDGTHTIDFSPDRRFFLDKWSRVDLPPVTELRRTEDGRLVCELERADWTALLATGWKPPERLTAKGRDGVTDIYGVIFRPTNFDPRNKYPVIESIYAGPQGSFVPKDFRSFYPEQAVAELGFIVVKSDGMGTSNRSKAFHDVCWKNLKDAGLPDRILWIKAAAAKLPAMDHTRVGIYGGSAGGQNAAAAVMTHGDFYRVAVADCGCHDNRMDKIWWNEQWMGWPVGTHYEANSNVTLAKGLQGKLLLIVGEMDTNVDPASTMQVVDALIRADKDFDLLVVPGSGHGAAERPYASRRRADYFVRHLLGVEPRSRP